MAWLGYTSTFVLDSLSYGASALVLLGLPAVQRRTAPGKVVVLLKESPSVVRRIWRAPALRTNMLFALLPMLVIMMATPNAYGLALKVYDMGPGGFAAMEFITALGWLTGERSPASWTSKATATRTSSARCWSCRCACSASVSAAASGSRSHY